MYTAKNDGGEHPLKHKWSFTARFRAGAYGWKASKLAIQRIREAVREIKAVNRHDRLPAAEGAVLFIEKLVPAIRDVDSSSGALGTAANNALRDLAGIIAHAEVDPQTREKWLERIWEAVQNDGYGYLDTLPDIWGELCVNKEIASRWADRFIDTVKHSWQHGGYFAGIPACLSCLLAAGRHEELLDLLEQAPYIWWAYRRFGVRALLKLGRKAEALRYAKESCGLNDNHIEMEEMCEEILLSSGLREDAYRQYAIPRLASMPGLASFRKVAKKYPEKGKKEILHDAVDSTPDEPGKWFATARQLGMPDLAVELAWSSPVDPRTLNRAAREYRESNPDFALDFAMASLHWMSQGWGYHITALDVLSAHSIAMEAARKLGKEKEVRVRISGIVEKDSSPGMFLRQVLDNYTHI